MCQKEENNTMDFMSFYNTMESSYEIGVGLEIKNYLCDSNDVKDFTMKYIDDELIIYIVFCGRNSRNFIYDFLSYISYDYLCALHRIDNQESIIYYIYTSISEKNTGIKIKMILKK